MKKEWFTQGPMTTQQAEHLIKKYTSQGKQTQKHLSLDPRFWLVSVYLPVSKTEPRQSARWQQKIWRMAK